jgi:hypothetical protein
MARGIRAGLSGSPVVWPARGGHDAQAALTPSVDDGQSGLLSGEGDDKALARNLEMLIGDETLRAQLGGRRPGRLLTAQPECGQRSDRRVLEAGGAMSEAALRQRNFALAGGGHTPRLWWRDDDATDATPALDRLTQLTGDAGVAVLLAVIPARASRPAGQSCGAVPPFRSVCAWLGPHQPRTGGSAKRAELGSARALDEVVADVALGHERLQVLFGEHLMPVLVPPWNRMRDDLVPRLAEAGLEGFSTFTHKLLAADMQANTHVDLMDWRASAGKPADTVLANWRRRWRCQGATGFTRSGCCRIILCMIVRHGTRWPGWWL